MVTLGTSKSLGDERQDGICNRQLATEIRTNEVVTIRASMVSARRDQITQLMRSFLVTIDLILRKKF